MNKKILGIKISTYLFAVISVVCAVVFWLYAKSVNIESSETASAVSMWLSSLFRIS